MPKANAWIDVTPRDHTVPSMSIVIASIGAAWPTADGGTGLLVGGREVYVRDAYDDIVQRMAL